MIHLHRLNESDVVVNAELIETIEAHGAETVLALATGNKIIVRESIPQVMERIIAYKKTVFAGATYLPGFLQGDKKEDTSCH